MPDLATFSLLSLSLLIPTFGLPHGQAQAAIECDQPADKWDEVGSFGNRGSFLPRKTGGIFDLGTEFEDGSNPSEGEKEEIIRKFREDIGKYCTIDICLCCYINPSRPRDAKNRRFIEIRFLLVHRSIN